MVCCGVFFFFLCVMSESSGWSELLYNIHNKRQCDDDLLLAKNRLVTSSCVN